VAARLHRNEYMGMLGGALLAVSVFLPWYGTDSDNRFANIDGERGHQSCFDVHPILRWLLIAAAVAPFILAYIIANDIKLSWARGEMTAVTSIAAFGLVFYNGIIDRPGEPSSAIWLEFGWFLAVLGTLMMIAGAALRSSEHERARKPPGTI
jgi:TRAP-type mannitol/chloroaromatic compound transport system permease small subunit